MNEEKRGTPPEDPHAQSQQITYPQAAQLFREQQYERALAAFLQLAEAGHGNACCFVGYLQANGLGCAPDKAQAVAWYRRGALAGDWESQRFLALALEEGQGTPQDLSAAVRWMRVSAEQGDAASQNDLGYYLATGTGVQKDMAEAYYWCALSARGGNQYAVKSLEGRVSHCMTAEELLRGHQLLWKGATPPLTDVLFLSVAQALLKKQARMAELETESRERDSDSTFTYKMEGECYAESLWLFVKAVDDLNPHDLWEGPGTVVSSVVKQKGGDP